MAKQGKFDEIDPEHYLRFHTTIYKINQTQGDNPSNLDNLPNNGKHHLWYYGPSGTGKSHAAREEFPDAYFKQAQTKWWDGYRGEDNVIIEDFDIKHEYMGFHLKIWADKYWFPAEVKNGGLKARPKHIIVTSNYHPKEIWTDEKTLQPILRRFKVVRFRTLGQDIGIENDTNEEEVRGYRQVAINNNNINMDDSLLS